MATVPPLEMAASVVIERIVTADANKRAEQVASILGPVIEADDVPWETTVELIRRLVADTYEVAYGRGYDDGAADGPPMLATPTPPGPSVLPCGDRT